ncbi:MAG: hypothetical protein GXY33_19175 [Phycisphaerae bacterium]|nr:hypothetical protein [Phycisphaerae bacterium]
MPYQGSFDKRTVPDTLDLADRAELALNGIGGCIDPQLHHMMFFHVFYTCREPYMRHHGADTTCDPKFAESFPMMRVMCGSSLYRDVESAQMDDLLSRIDDGLYWNRYEPSRPWYNSYNPDFDGVRKNEDLAMPGAAGRMVRTLATWRELDGNTGRDRYIRELVDGLFRIAVHRNAYSYYPDGGFGEPFNYPRSGWIRTDEPKSETEGGEGAVTAFQAHQIQGLCRWYAASGDQKALDLAGRLTRFCMLPKFWGGLPDPEGNREGLAGQAIPHRPDPVGVAGHEQGHWFSHFHARAITLRGVLEYAMAVGDQRILEFVRRAYEYTLTFAIPRIGWFNCFPGRLNVCEGCALGDMVALAIRLTDAGLGDFWDDVDAVVRNHLVEQQLIDASLLERVAAHSSERPPEDHSRYPGQETTDNVIQRSLGVFAGLSTPVSIPGPWIMQCCTGNASQGLYYAWEGIVRRSGDSAQVNLLLNRADPSLDIDSYLPHEGKVVIRNKTNRRISIRIPSWVDRKEIRTHVSGRPRPSEDWVGNFLVFDDLKPGNEICIDFPIRETVASYTANCRTPMEQTYACRFRGGTLVDISPRDDSPTSYPLYQRDLLRNDKTPMKKKRRFVPEKTILHW